MATALSLCIPHGNREPHDISLSNQSGRPRLTPTPWVAAGVSVWGWSPVQWAGDTLPSPLCVAVAAD